MRSSKVGIVTSLFESNSWAWLSLLLTITCCWALSSLLLTWHDIRRKTPGGSSSVLLHDDSINDPYTTPYTTGNLTGWQSSSLVKAGPWRTGPKPEFFYWPVLGRIQFPARSEAQEFFTCFVTSLASKYLPNMEDELPLIAKLSKGKAIKPSSEIQCHKSKKAFKFNFVLISQNT